MTDRKNSFVDADLPIEDRESDRLGRRAFAESIATHILDVSIDHGFTVAVTGEWGSGKTSVLNMVAETLKPESTDGRPWGQPLKQPEGAPLNLG